MELGWVCSVSGGTKAFKHLSHFCTWTSLSDDITKFHGNHLKKIHIFSIRLGGKSQSHVFCSVQSCCSLVHHSQSECWESSTHRYRSQRGGTCVVDSVPNICLVSCNTHTHTHRHTHMIFFVTVTWKKSGCALICHLVYLHSCGSVQCSQPGHAQVCLSCQCLGLFCRSCLHFFFTSNPAFSPGFTSR